MLSKRLRITSNLPRKTRWWIPIAYEMQGMMLVEAPDKKSALEKVLTNPKFLDSHQPKQWTIDCKRIRRA